MQDLPNVTLDEAEVVVTLPRGEDAAMGGPLVWVLHRKYIQVNLSGTIDGQAYAGNAYEQQFSYPDDRDLAQAIEAAVARATGNILRKLPLPPRSPPATKP